MDLLHIVATPRSRGAESFALNLARELGTLEMSQGLAVLGSERIVQSFDVDSLQKVDITARSWVTKSCALRRLLKDSTPTHVLCHGLTPLKVALLASRGLPRMTIVMKKIGMTAPWVNGRRLSLAASRVAARAADAHIVLGANQKQELITVLKVDPAKIVIIPNARRNLALPPGAVPRDPALVVFVGALEEEKRPDVALRVISQLIKDGIDVRLRFLGDGRLRPSLERMAASAAPGQVEFCGTVSDVWPHLAEASLLILTSRTEGVPGVLIEASMAGLPAVCWDVGDVTSVVRNGDNGFVVPYEQEAALKESVATLLSNPKLWQEMSVSARGVSVGFEIGRVAPKYHEFFRNLEVARRED